MSEMRDKGIGPAINAKILPEGVESRFNITKRTIKAKNSTESDRNVAIIDVEGPIGYDWYKEWEGEEQNDSTTMRQRVAEIDALQVDEIKVNIIESPGGVIEDGIGMYEALVRHPAKVVTEVSGYAASIATILMLAGDERRISSNAMALSHSAMLPICGYLNSTELRNAIEEAELLDSRIQSIMEKHGVDMEAIKPMMAADNGNGKWMDAEQAVEIGLATETFEVYRAVARVDFNNFKAVAQHFGLPVMPEAPKNIADGQEPINNKNNADNKEEPTMALSAEDKKDIAEIMATALAAKNDVEVQTPVAPELEKPVNEVEVEFTGDPMNQEDLDAHKMNLKKAQLKAACNFNDIDSVEKYQKALARLDKEAGGAPSAPAFNSTVTQEVVKPQAENKAAEDLKDTKEAMAKVMKKLEG